MHMVLPVAALLLSVALLLIGHGLQLTLLPLRANLVGFDAMMIGWRGSTCSAGFATGCFSGAWVIRRAGHIRSFAVLAAIYLCAVQPQAQRIGVLLIASAKSVCVLAERTTGLRDRLGSRMTVGTREQRGGSGANRGKRSDQPREARPVQRRPRRGQQAVGAAGSRTPCPGPPLRGAPLWMSLVLSWRRREGDPKRPAVSRGGRAPDSPV